MSHIKIKKELKIIKLFIAKRPHAAVNPHIYSINIHKLTHSRKLV